MAALHEQYRPRAWSEVAGQEAAVKAIQAVLANGWGGRAWWITGASGTGKTTLANLIAAEGASDIATDEIQASGLMPADLRHLERSCACRPLPHQGKSGWAFIVNECHKLRRDTVTALLDVLERVPDYVVWIFTTTKIGEASLFEDDIKGDCAPLKSRCTDIALEDTAESRAALGARARLVAQLAGKDGLPESAYVAAIHAAKGNLRTVLAQVEAGQIKPARKW